MRGRAAGAGLEDRGGVQQVDDQGLSGHGQGEVQTERSEGDYHSVNLENEMILFKLGGEFWPLSDTHPLVLCAAP